MNIRRVMTFLSEGIIPPPYEAPGWLLKLAASAMSLRGKVMNLSSLERTFAALYHKEPDRVPVTPLLCSAARQIRGLTFPDMSLDGRRAADVFCDGFDVAGGDFIELMLDLSVEAADFGQKMVYPEDTTARPDYGTPSIRTVDDYRKIRTIKLSEAPRMQEFITLCRLVVRRVGFRGIVGGFVFGPAGVLSMMRGAEHFLKDCLLHPKEVTAACETITEVLIDYVRAQCDAGVPAVAIDTLYASASGLPKKVWEEIEGPFVREISMAVKQKGHMVGIHNCGYQNYADAQLKWMEPEVYSFAHLPDDCRTPQEMKEKYGAAMTLVGYVSTHLLVHGTPMEVMDECRRQIDVMGKGGGFILAPGCEYPPNIPLTNAFAMVKAAEKFG